MKKLLSITTLVLSLVLISCKSTSENSLSCNDPGVGTLAESAFSQNFKSYLQANYPDLANSEGWGGGVPGCETASRNPVIFIHGNNDYSQSWQTIRQYFLNNGYTPAELYAIGWGNKGTGENLNNFHKAEWIGKIRRFIEAVKNYTGKNVNIISHSMGVTMTMKAILGGNAYDTYDRSGGATNLGSPISSYIKVFIGIAGGVRGVNLCDATGYGIIYSSSHNCDVNGFKKTGGFITDLISLATSTKVASKVFSILSSHDEIICTKDYKSDYITPTWGGDDLSQYNPSELLCEVSGIHTSRIPQEDQTYTYDQNSFISTFTYNLWKSYHLGNHFALRDETGSTQVNIIINNQ
ncbi:MAG TPA: hypothetical protein PKW55_01415 [Spirochaetota bacterium]|nr:hypothetical protein [Spirochaetota bacterium]HPQ49146.1 hypothetical protein [Spirochaetota bacterium]